MAQDRQNRYREYYKALQKQKGKVRTPAEISPPPETLWQRRKMIVFLFLKSKTSFLKLKS